MKLKVSEIVLFSLSFSVSVNRGFSEVNDIFMIILSRASLNPQSSILLFYLINDRNLRLAQTKMSEEKKQVAESLIENYFKRLPTVHWENIEVNNYWSEMEKQGLTQASDL